MNKPRQSGIFKLTSNAYKKFKHKLEGLKKKNLYEEKPINEPTSPKKDRVIVDISPMSVAKATLVVILLYALTQFVIAIHVILIVFFVSLLFSAAISPWINKMEEKRIPRSIGVILIYIGIFAFLWILVISFIPVVAAQISELADRGQSLIHNLVTNDSGGFPIVSRIKETLQRFIYDLDTQLLIDNALSTLNQLSDSLGGVAGNIWAVIKILFNSIFYFILVLFLTYFMAVDSRAIEDFIKSLFPSRHGNYIAEKAFAIKEKIGCWMRAQVLLMIWVGLLTFIGLKIIGIQYAATLALFAGLAELIPVAGPILAFMAALPIAANQSGWLVFWLLGLFIVIQQIEGNILIPIIMKKTVGLNPIVIFFVMMVGYHFLSILGIILSVPVATTANIFIQDYIKKEK